jgi:hypothetical protein
MARGPKKNVRASPQSKRKRPAPDVALDSNDEASVGDPNTYPPDLPPDPGQIGDVDASLKSPEDQDASRISEPQAAGPSNISMHRPPSDATSGLSDPPDVREETNLGPDKKSVPVGDLGDRPATSLPIEPDDVRLQNTSPGLPSSPTVRTSPPTLETGGPSMAEVTRIVADQIYRADQMMSRIMERLDGIERSQSDFQQETRLQVEDLHREILISRSDTGSIRNRSPIGVPFRNIPAQQPQVVPSRAPPQRGTVLETDDGYIIERTRIPNTGDPGVVMTAHFPIVDTVESDATPGSPNRRIPSHLKGKGVERGPLSPKPAVTRPVTRKLPTVEDAPPSSDEERDPTPRIPRVDPGPVTVRGRRGESEGRQRSLFASRAPSETSIKYTSRLDRDAAYVYGPGNLDAHAQAIRKKLDTYGRYAISNANNGFYENPNTLRASRREGQSNPIGIPRQEASTPQPTIHTHGNPLNGGSRPITVSPVKREYSSTGPRVVSATQPASGFVESTLRSYSRDPNLMPLGDPEGFMSELVRRIANLVRMRILTPLPPEVRPELLKKNSVPFPTTLWAGENDLEKFESWLVELTSWISGNGWKGEAYNEVHIDALARALDGDPKQIVLHDVKQGFENGIAPTFVQLLTKLMLTYVKRSAAVPATKLFKTLSYDSSKGIKHFYIQLLRTSEKMITRPDQASFNERFLNALPLHMKEELVMRDRISVDFSSKEELWTAVLRVDHAYDSMRAINAYRGGWNASSKAHSTSKPSGSHTSKPSSGAANKTAPRNNAHSSSSYPSSKKPVSTTKPVSASTTKAPVQAQNSNSSRYSKNTGNTSTYVRRPSKDSKGNPLCYKCGKVGYSFECPNHPSRKLFALGVDEEDPAPLPDVNDQEEGGDPPAEMPEEPVADDDEADRFVEDPYEPEDQLDELDTESEGEVAFGYVGLRGMGFVDATEDNYALKLASAQQADRLLSEERLIAELVDEPVRRFKLEGQVPLRKSEPEMVPAKLIKKNPPMFDAKLRLSREAGKYPTDRSADLRRTLTGLVEINGTKAFTLFDSGAETDAISPDFVRACHIPLLELPNPLVLQMGTKGSRSCIYYGTNVDLNILGRKNKHYFDVVNIERYDAILGAPWLNTYKAMLDFDKHVIHVFEGKIPSFDVPTERSFVSTGRQARRKASGLIKPRKSTPDSIRATKASTSRKL